MKMKLYLFTLFQLLIISLIASQSAFAEVVTPTGRETYITGTYDLSSAPSKIDIWVNETGGVDTSNPYLWGRNNWRCLSSTSPATGKCKSGEASAGGGDWGGKGHTLIPTLFIEKRTHAQAVINIEGYHNSDGVQYYLTAAAINIAPQALNNTWISQTELAKLPIGGIWEAHLAMDLWQWSPGKKLGRWNAYITLNVTDMNRQQIYLPEFGQAEPLIDLNLRPLPGTTGYQSILHGKKTLNMCLYDGYNAESSQFTVQIKGAGSLDRPANVFSVYREGGSRTADEDRIDFFVKMFNPVSGEFMDVNRGQNIVITDIQHARIRQVHLPEIPQPVICVPSALKLETGDIAMASKTQGRYVGIMTIVFTPQY